jgi:hypothetical protein
LNIDISNLAAGYYHVVGEWDNGKTNGRAGEIKTVIDLPIYELSNLVYEKIYALPVINLLVAAGSLFPKIGH